MKRLPFTAASLLVVVTSLVACSGADEYRGWYDVLDICCYHPDNLGYLEFELAKDEVLSGKIVVDYGTVVFFASDHDPIPILEAAVNPVRVKQSQEYSFSVKAKQATRYICFFRYPSWFTSAQFYCNRPADEGWADNRDPWWKGAYWIPM